MEIRKFLIRTSVPRIWASAALPLIFAVAYFVFIQPDVPLLQPDSAGYLQFSAIRTGGYPFFLELFKPIAGDPYAYTIVQRLLYLVATAILGLELLLLTGNIIFVLAIQAALLANPLVNEFHFTLLTESVFLAVVIFCVAASSAYLRTRTLWALVLASAAAGCAVAIRPIGIGILAMPLFLVILQSPIHWSRRLAGIIIPFLITVTLEAGYYYSVHGFPRQSVTSTVIIGKAAMIDAPFDSRASAAQDAPAQKLAAALQQDLVSVRRLVAAAPSRAAKCRLLVNYETFVQSGWRVTLPPELGALLSDHMLAEVGLRRIASAPFEYAAHVVDNLYCLLSLWLMSAEEKSAYADYVLGSSPIPYNDAVMASLATRPSAPYAAEIRALLFTAEAALLIFSLTAAALLFSGKIAPPTLALSGACAITFYTSILLTGMTGVGIPRYFLSLWPLFVVAGGLGAVWVWQLRQRLLSRMAN